MDLASTPVIKTDQTRSNPGAPTAALLKNVPSQPGRFITSLQQSAPAALSSVTPSAISQASVTKQAMNSVSRLTALPVHSSSSSSTYHVPRGAAAVANIAVPRSSLATPIRGSSANLQALGVAAPNNTTMVRGMAPQHSSSGGPVGVRPPPPHSSGGTSGWLSNNSSRAPPLPHSTAPPTTATPPHFTRASPIGVTRLTAPLTTGRVVTDSLSRPVLLQSTTHKQINISNINQQAQLHLNDKTFLKTTGVSMGVRAQGAAVVTSSGGGGRGPNPSQGTAPAVLNRIGGAASLPHAAVVSLHPNTVLVQTPAVPLKQQPSHTPKFVAQSPHMQQQMQSNSITSSSAMTSSKPMSFSTSSVSMSVGGRTAPPPPLHQNAASKVLPVVAASDAAPSPAASAAFLHKPTTSSVTVPNVVGTSSNVGSIAMGSGAHFETGQLQPRAAPTSAAAQLPASTTHAHTHTPNTCRPASSIVTNSQPTVRYNPLMAVEHNRQVPLHHFVNNPPSEAAPCSQPAEGSASLVSGPAAALTPTKPNASPRPSILRKRETEGSPLKASKNLTPLLTSLSVGVPPPGSPPPSRPESRGGNGGNQSSGGSTTISATSSPGMVAGDRDESPPLQSLAAAAAAATAKHDGIQPEPPPTLEMSPRKKPRKQQLTGNQMQEPKHEVEMEFISEEKLRKESKDGDLDDGSEPGAGLRKGGSGSGGGKRRSAISLLSSYRHTWKSRHHHFLRYTDVKPKEERRPTINEIASHKMVHQKINGWKLYHLGTQMQCLSDLETEVLEKLTDMLKVLERKPGKELDKDINRVNELIKGNIQRCKVIKDQMQEAKTQVMKIFDHKGHVIEILSRCSSKRSVKKRDRM